MVVMKTPFW